MDMCYDGALVMPSSYAVMNEEEMTYVEGGGFWEKAIYHGVAFAANCAFNAILGGGTVGLVWKVICTKKDAIVGAIIQVLSKWLNARAINYWVGSFFGCIFDYGLTSAGGALAEALDRADGKNDNQIYFSRIF